MKLIRVVARIAAASLAAAFFVALTQAYARSVRLPLPDPGWRADRAHRPSAPELGKIPEAIGEGVVVVICAVAGRIVFRLRLLPASRSEGQPILLGLREEPATAKLS
jgi:hypothetical protein